MPQPLSLKSNILLLNALILGSVLALLGTTFYFYEYQKRIGEIDVSLDQLVTPLRGEYMRSPGERKGRKRSELRSVTDYFSVGLEGTDWERRRNDLFADERSGHHPGGFEGQFETLHVPQGFYTGITRRSNGEFVFKSSNFPDIEVPHGTYQGLFYRFRGDNIREMLNGDRHMNFLIGLNMTSFRADLQLLKLQITGAAVLIFVLALGFWYVFITRRLEPLKSIQDTAIKIADGELSKRIAPEQEGCAKEFDILIRELNHSFAQLDKSFQRQLRFTADASHELKTPLTVLMAHIDLALKGSRSTEEYQSMLQICSQSCSRLNRIIQELLEISRYDAGSVRLEFETLPLDAVIQGLVEEMKGYAQERNAVIKTDLNSGSFLMDPFRIEQLLTNLINNALQHNDDPITVTIRSRIIEDNAIIEVIDDGKGIQPENIDKLFDRFYQEDPSRSKNGETQNTGLGLSISKAIVEAHGGQINVESILGKRTVFRIQLPRN